mmetsp:Transcript_38747/g.79168  ORF Transcript_38747/g.79168 Transcript_38747/m.79168 type:complete len:402 (-) Transcript_38747:972-2177(-)
MVTVTMDVDNLEFGWYEMSIRSAVDCKTPILGIRFDDSRTVRSAETDGVSQEAINIFDIHEDNNDEAPIDFPSEMPIDASSESNPSTYFTGPPTESRSPSAIPSSTPSSSSAPSVEDSEDPSSTPSSSSVPSDEASANPSSTPSPSSEPSKSSLPSALPSNYPSVTESGAPSVSMSPTNDPSSVPSSSPSNGPSIDPSNSSAPSGSPSVTASPTSCPAICISVSQSSSSVVVPVADFADAVDFYSFGSPLRYSYNGEVQREPETCLMFLYENLNDCGSLSLFVVMDAPDSTRGVADMVFSGDFSVPDVGDDPTSNAKDDYTYNSSTEETNVHWEWAGAYTDGLAKSVPLNEVGDSIYVKIVPGTLVGIDYWKFVSGPGTDGTTSTDLNLADTLTIARVACS